ncbi:phospholipid/glycerol acyltransferase [Desulfurispirillum indicum S5]|uniref:Phospholipid/glycerol acyltransferase n=1 Tax=Desulfurispirillum indicum (strain ATCC BAA-1389 / DSM 22839 / S5) TaxID=653733 RepID=E6W6Z5_DESIS|nr:phospholipid/glycerol acyltransferase [Desulfurispirillum indicum S5]
MGKTVKQRLYQFYIGFLVNFSRMLFFVLNRLQVKGDQYIPTDARAVLYVSNHVSFLETMAIPMTIVGRQKVHTLRIAAKEELLQIPVIGRVLRSIHIIPVKRGSGAKAYAAILQNIRQGNSILVFPEGTRAKDGIMKRPKRAIGKLMHESGLPIVPIRVDGLHTWRLWKLGQKGALTFGEPFAIDEILPVNQDEEAIDYQLVADKVMEKIRSLC